VRPTAGASTLRFYLSTGRPGASATPLGSHATRRVRAGGDKTTVENRFAAPRGEYALWACADATKRVRESDERNDCAGSADLMTVTP
jgi:hypothetical protein